MKSFVLKVLGVPVRPHQGNMSAQVGYWMNWLFSVLFAAFIFLHIFPSIVFQHKMTAHGITVHSRLPIPATGDRVLAKAAVLVSASELAVPGRAANVYIADEPWVFWLFAPFKSSFAVSVPITNNIFIGNGDFDGDIARSRKAEFNSRALSAVIAHEITHGLIIARLGLIDSLRAPSWVTEGYCDYIAREGSFPEQRGLAMLASGSTHPSESFEYFVGRQLVTYLIEQKKMTFEQIASAAIRSEELHATAAAEIARH